MGSLLRLPRFRTILQTQTLRQQWIFTAELWLLLKAASKSQKYEMQKYLWRPPQRAKAQRGGGERSILVLQGKVLALVGLVEFLQMITLIVFKGIGIVGLANANASVASFWFSKTKKLLVRQSICKWHIWNTITKEIPVTAESTNAEAEAMKLGPMDGGRELKEIKPYQYCTDRKTMSRLCKPGSSGRSWGCRCGPTQADQVGCTGQAWKKKRWKHLLLLTFLKEE